MAGVFAQSLLLVFAGQAQVDFELSRSLRLLLQAERQWGSNLRGTSVHVGVWRSF